MQEGRLCSQRQGTGLGSGGWQTLPEGAAFCQLKGLLHVHPSWAGTSTPGEGLGGIRQHFLLQWKRPSLCEGLVGKGLQRRQPACCRAIAPGDPGFESLLCRGSLLVPWASDLPHWVAVRGKWRRGKWCDMALWCGWAQFCFLHLREGKVPDRATQNDRGVC